MSKSLTTIKATPFKSHIKNVKFGNRVAKAAVEIQVKRDPFVQVRSQVQLGGISRRVAEERARLAEMRG